jgi:hypothetical protein
MLGFKEPAQPSPMLGDAHIAGFRYLKIRCAGCDPVPPLICGSCATKGDTPIHELKRWTA